MSFIRIWKSMSLEVTLVGVGMYQNLRSFRSFPEQIIFEGPKLSCSIGLPKFQRQVASPLTSSPSSMGLSVSASA